MAKKRDQNQKKPGSYVTIVRAPMYNVSSSHLTSSTSGTATIFQDITMPDGRQMRLLSKEVFDRALEKTKKKK